MVETILSTLSVPIIFALYLLLWSSKRFYVKQKNGIDVNVLKANSSSIQKYILFFSKFLTFYIVLCIILHLLNVRFYGLFTPWSLLDGSKYDIAGIIISFTGLGFCFYSQIKMGASWRVGIDEKNDTQLITSGIYKYIRNPTYVGLMLINIGTFLIWPTLAIFIFIYSFFIFLEIQTRCEEDFLLKKHGKEYEKYKKSSKRYVPFLY